MANLEEQRSEVDELEKSAASPTGPVGVEPDEPPTRAIFALVAGVFVFVGLAGLGLWQLFGLLSLDEIETKDLRVDNKELLELRARDWGRLTQYEALDGGAYQIPIERAMDKLVSHPDLILPLRRTDAGADGADAGMDSALLGASEPDALASSAVSPSPASGSATPAEPASSEANP